MHAATTRLSCTAPRYNVSCGWTSFIQRTGQGDNGYRATVLPLVTLAAAASQGIHYREITRPSVSYAKCKHHHLPHILPLWPRAGVSTTASPGAGKDLRRRRRGKPSYDPMWASAVRAWLVPSGRYAHCSTQYMYTALHRSLLYGG